MLGNLAVAVLSFLAGFGARDFLYYHNGGKGGKRLRGKQEPGSVDD